MSLSPDNPDVPTPASSQGDAGPLTQRDILLFWLPLCASWLLMTAEGPLLSTVVNRLPDEVVMLAALGIVISLAVTIESPIINLLATATALVKDRASFELVRRFTLHWMAALTVVSFLVAFTPLFDLVVRSWLAAPDEVALWVRPGLQLLTLWSAAIAWRRFLQGVLIHFGHTRQVGRGTVLRLASTAGVAFGLWRLSDWPGIIIAAGALLAGVCTEAVYATLAVRPVLRDELAPAAGSGPPELTYRDLFWFHLPLAGTSVLALMTQPLVTFTLARLERPTLTLAAWPLIFHLTLVMRAPAFSLPEAVIALGRRSGSERPLRRFSLSVAGAALAAMLLLAATPLAGFYLVDLQDAAGEVAALARSGLVLFIPLPALATLLAWSQGRLIGAARTRVVNEGMALGLAATAGLLMLGLAQRWPGLNAAAVAINLSLLLQWLYLQWRLRR